MKDETTNRLEGLLKDVNSAEAAEEFARKHEAEYGSFNDYINVYVNKSGDEFPRVIERSGISTNYVYNILNGVTKKPGRDKVLALCIAAGMNLDEVNRGLRVSGHNSLYPKNERDIYIASCINRGVNSVLKINLELEERGLGLIEV